MKITHINSVDKIPELDNQPELKKVEELYRFKSTTYYNSLIDWEDPEDPIRNIIIPGMDEIDSWGELDASGEAAYQKMEGMEHKYKDTVLLLVTNSCEAYCRYCFRKRLFLEDNDETIKSVSRAIEYIKTHKEINNVLLTGGDPMSLAPSRLMEILSELEGIEHLDFIRLGSKILSFNPHKILDNPKLLAFFAEYKKPIYYMSHFANVKEITEAAQEAVKKLLATNNIIISNQTPILKGVNDAPDAQKALLSALVKNRITPYYFFQMRPVKGNKKFIVPIERNIEIFHKSLQGMPGLIGRLKLVMSHKSGKIELVGMDEKKIYMKYHRAQKIEDFGRMMVFDRDPEACWLDDYLQQQA